MSRVAISTGATANDGTGDTLRAAGGIINANFAELYTYLGAGSTDTLSAPIWDTTVSGINTLRNVGLGTTNPRFALEVGAVGASGTSLWVNGDARITGILTIGTSSITLNGSSNTINVGSGVTIDGSTGVIEASSLVVGGTTLTGVAVTFITAGSGISVDQNTGNVTITATGGGGGGESYWFQTTAGIHTLSNVGIGTTNPTSKLTVKGNTSLETLSVSGVSTFPINISKGVDFVNENASGKVRISADGGIDSGRISFNDSSNNPRAIIESDLSIGWLNIYNYGYGGTGDISLIPGGAVSLYHGGTNKKFETLGTGVTVTGTIFTNQLISSGIVTATSFSGSNTLKERTVISGITTEIANNGIGNTNITGYKSYALMKVGLSTEGWLRLYTDDASRSADVSRSVGIDPTPGSGVIAEVVTTGISTTQIISPFVMGGNLDDPADTTIYAAITNLSGVTTSISVNLTLLQLEA